MQRSYHDVNSIISPTMFRRFPGGEAATDVESHSSVIHEASISQNAHGRYLAEGMADDGSYTKHVSQPGSYRTPLRAKVAAIHAARAATSSLGYSN